MFRKVLYVFLIIFTYQSISNLINLQTNPNYCSWKEWLVCKAGTYDYYLASTFEIIPTNECVSGYQIPGGSGEISLWYFIFNPYSSHPNPIYFTEVGMCTHTWFIPIICIGLLIFFRKYIK